MLYVVETFQILSKFRRKLYSFVILNPPEKVTVVSFLNPYGWLESS